jgi:alkylhydroperoxidase/carboxymuconolactone decarboxylase family protein YurZ
MHSALKKGATKDEILEVVLIAGSLAQAAVLADAYRIIDAGTANGCGATCDTNGVKLKKNGD